MILDVVYNHLGPDGNYLRASSRRLLHRRRYENDWGDALNFDGPIAAPVREFFVENAALLDRRVSFRRPAARRDAAHLRRVARARRSRRIVRPRARGGAAAHRCISSPRTSRRTRGWSVPARARRLRPRRAVERRLSPQPRRRADRPARGVLHGLPRRRRRSSSRAAKYGYLYQGQWYSLAEAAARHAGARPPAARVRHLLENHDQVANTPSGGGCTIHGCVAGDATGR